MNPRVTRYNHDLEPHKNPCLTNRQRAVEGFHVGILGQGRDAKGNPKNNKPGEAKARFLKAQILRTERNMR